MYNGERKGGKGGGQIRAKEIEEETVSDKNIMNNETEVDGSREHASEGKMSDMCNELIG